MVESVVLIKSLSTNSFGTGFCIECNDNISRIVTCKHVIKGDEIEINGLQAQLLDAVCDDELDLAIVEVKGLTLPPLKIGKPNSTNTGKVIGFTTLIDNIIKEPIHNIAVKNGVFITTLTSDKKFPALQLSTNEPISVGYSGSPLICERTNTAIGIVNIQKNETSNYALCISNLPAIINDSNDSNQEDYKVTSSISRELSEPEDYWITKQFEESLEDALTPFSTNPVPWIKPNLQLEPDETQRFKNEQPFDYNKLIDHKGHSIIFSRQQYGASSLCHYIKNETWTRHKAIWVYLNANNLKPHKKELVKAVNKILKKLSLCENDIHGIILDEVSADISSVNEIIALTFEIYRSKSLLFTCRRSDDVFGGSTIKYPSSFKQLYLWPLRRKDIRQLVSLYNQKHYISDDDKLLSKIVRDLDALCVPRTAKNCQTLLKISETQFDDSPVNRSEMIGRVLFLLFNLDNLPKYKTIPDVKDTEFVLGYFCETIIRSESQLFTESYFTTLLNKFCEAHELELNINVIFDILVLNNIIIARQGKFCFKFKYWILYFAAQRMLHSTEFADYIFSKRNYVSYPEIIEFYTGIDRRRNDAIEVISADLSNIVEEVVSKTHLPASISIYEQLKWEPTQQQLNLVEEEVSNTLENSCLPNELKDSFADRNYDHLPTLNQNIHKIMDEYSLLKLFKGLTAACQALRNSDYATKPSRHKLINTILNGQEALNNALVALSPVLATEGEVTADGATFILTGDIEGSFLNKLLKVVSILPSNVSTWFSDEIFSEKMGPLIKNQALKTDNKIHKHYLHLLIAMKKPKDWKDVLSNYIFENEKNSFFLKDLNECLISEYKYSFSSPKQLNEAEVLVKMIVAKHKNGIKRPGQKAINSLKGKINLEREI